MAFEWGRYSNEESAPVLSDTTELDRVYLKSRIKQMPLRCLLRPDSKQLSRFRGCCPELEKMAWAGIPKWIYEVGTTQLNTKTIPDSQSQGCTVNPCLMSESDMRETGCFNAGMSGSLGKEEQR